MEVCAKLPVSTIVNMKNTEIKIVIFYEGDSNVSEFAQLGGFYDAIGVNE